MKTRALEESVRKVSLDFGVREGDKTHLEDNFSSLPLPLLPPALSLSFFPSFSSFSTSFSFFFVNFLTILFQEKSII